LNLDFGKISLAVDYDSSYEILMSMGIKISSGIGSFIKIDLG
jgi:hypothetical protein